MKPKRKIGLVFWGTILVLTIAAVAVAVPGFRNVAILKRENQARERIRSGAGPSPGYVVVSSPIGSQAIPERYGDTGRYTFFTHPDHGVLKLDIGGRPLDRIPSDADLGIRRPPPK